MFLFVTGETLAGVFGQVPTEIAVAGPNLPESELQLGQLVCQALFGIFLMYRLYSGRPLHDLH